MPVWQQERIGVQFDLAQALVDRELVTVGQALGETYVDAGYRLDAPDFMPAGSCSGLFIQTLVARDSRPEVKQS